MKASDDVFNVPGSVRIAFESSPSAWRLSHLRTSPAREMRIASAMISVVLAMASRHTTARRGACNWRGYDSLKVLARMA